MESLEDKIGYVFKNKKLLKQALTHSSITSDVQKNYERLEFLGDRVLGVSMAHLLYFTFQNEPEGFLSPRFVSLVRKETVAEVALKLGLDKFIKVNPPSICRNENILCDVMEALIGAICLDSGFETAIAFVDKHFKTHINKDAAPERIDKTALQELAAHLKAEPPVYEVIKTEGSSHEPVFYIKCEVKGKATAVGVGKNKKLAEQDAAAQVLRILEDANAKG